MMKIPALELRRKWAHLVLVLAYATALWLGIGWQGSLVLLVIALAVALSYSLTKKRGRPLFRFLELVEREEHRRIIPAKNVLSLLVAGTVASLLFPRTAAVAGFLVLAVGDPLAYLVGKKYGRVPLPWNKRKHLEGRLAAVIVCTPILAALYPWQAAIPAALLGMLFESLHYPHDILVDDNLVLPLVVAVALTLL